MVLENPSYYLDITTYNYKKGFVHVRLFYVAKSLLELYYIICFHLGGAHAPWVPLGYAPDYIIYIFIVGCADAPWVPLG